MISALFRGVALCFFLTPLLSRAQLQERATGDSVRVTVSMNQDGSRTAYEFDPANKKATATTTNAAGKSLRKILYELDDAGRFAKGEVRDGRGRFEFKTLYKYDSNARLTEEDRLTMDGALMNKLVYAYGPDGKQSGYSVYDSAGKLLGSTKPALPASAPGQKKAK